MALSRERLQQLIDRSTDIVVGTDGKGTVVYYNDGATRILGYKSEEIMNEFVGRLYPSVDEAKRVMEAMRSPDHGGVGYVETFETEFLAKSGARVPVAISATLISDEEGRENGTIGFAKDLRDILHREGLARLGEAAVGLSHEINNSLAVITNQVELLDLEIERLAGDRDSSVECERLDAVSREVARISEILARFGEMVRADEVETVTYVGPTKMVDLSSRQRGEKDERLAGLRMLIVDDDDGICRTLQEILEVGGCEVETAPDGAEALIRIQRSKFDLVLSDVVMPNMDGHELYQAIKRDHPALPILLMTAFHHDKDHIIKRSRMQGLEGVVFKKPVDPAKLRDAIAAAAGRS
ncbi:MAG: response regulator [Myxococcota bacterium]|nr:response regulator [Myxococcota bacterium]